MPAAAPSPITVLLVDDHDEVRTLTQMMLDGLGYAVVQAADADAALAELARADVRVDLLLSDVTMRPVDGVELARRARAGRPELPVLLMSGEPAMASGWAVLAKPFTMDGLDAAVRAALARG